ncbi:hypothetical protein L1267_12195 [Pseudoalteromonas sp. OFAV1]|uniref:hypothetical protein n=1 Tax=Pseudoalteromonas sp. OFAV1 TaxID=2908892 RepID=UPI001F2A6E61|nr:hypothetical protein [Pseudoalteromonas sp. OFAV1]MCF2901152.1 hypothetical protein [Pseudoalteromonas sp. OFAV1]
MRSLLIEKGKEFHEIAVKRDMKVAIELYMSLDSDRQRCNFLFIASTNGFVEFIDYVFHSLDQFKEAKDCLNACGQFVSNEKHAILLYERTKDFSGEFDGYLLDVATSTFYNDDLMLLKAVLEAGYTEKGNYAYGEDESLTLLELASIKEANKCTAFLIEHGYVAHKPENMPIQCWAYPWPVNILEDYSQYQYIFEDVSKEFLDIHRISDDERKKIVRHLVCWLNEHCESVDALKAGLTFAAVMALKMIHKGASCSVLDDIKCSIGDSSRMKHLLDDLKFNGGLNLSNDILLLVFLADFELENERDAYELLKAFKKNNLIFTASLASVLSSKSKDFLLQEMYDGWTDTLPDLDDIFDD